MYDIVREYYPYVYVHMYLCMQLQWVHCECKHLDIELKLTCMYVCMYVCKNCTCVCFSSCVCIFAYVLLPMCLYILDFCIPSKRWVWVGICISFRHYKAEYRTYNRISEIIFYL